MDTPTSTIAQKIRETPGNPIRNSKDNVEEHEFEGKKYYIKIKPTNEVTFKILLYFRLLHYMGINIPNIMAYSDKGATYIISEECGTTQVSPLGELPREEVLRKQIAKIIYTADLLGLYDIATDNIIQHGNDLFLIDFELTNPTRNFCPINPFDGLGDAPYTVAKSFAQHNTKGNIELLRKLSLTEEPNDLSIDEMSKREIERRFFFSIPGQIDDAVDYIFKCQFPRKSIDKDQLNEITEKLRSRCKELCRSYNRIAGHGDVYVSQEQYEEYSYDSSVPRSFASPKSSYLQGSEPKLDDEPCVLMDDSSILSDSSFTQGLYRTERPMSARPNRNIPNL